MGRHSNNSKKTEVSISARRKITALAEKLKGMSEAEREGQAVSIQKVLSAFVENRNGKHPPNEPTNGSNNSTSRHQPLSKSNSTLDSLGKFVKASVKFPFMSMPKVPSKSNLYCAFFSILALVFYFELHTSSGFTRLWLKWENVDLRSVECTIESPGFTMELFRPPVPCMLCHNVVSADRVSNISPAEFERRYAYSGRPVIITDAMSNWTAASSFTFSFLKSIYGEGSRSLQHQGEDCLFFPYETEFRSLAEVFNMSQERSTRPWYIGWSNCDSGTSHVLRQHYDRPYFLPTTAESTHADWIFMGTPGYGAHMHIDHVINPSWQAQITGRKRWFLQPPPECFHHSSCSSFHVDVEPGEIIVLDTNKWYHSTQILSNEMSITIGSEYD